MKRALSTRSIPLNCHQLPRNRIGGLRAGDQPEARVLSLLGGAFAARSAAELPDLVVIVGPLFARERDRRLRTELRRARHGEWPYVGPHGGDRDRRRHIDAGLGLRA